MTPLDYALPILGVLTILNYRLHRAVLYPPFVLCSVWLLDFALYRSNLIEVDPIHANTLVIVVGGLTLFSFGGLLASLIPSPAFRVHFLPTETKSHSDLMRKTLTLILVLSLPFFVLQLIHEGAAGTGATLFSRARSVQIESLESGDVHWSLLGYVGLFTVYVPLLFAVGKRDWMFWTTSFVAMAVAAIGTGRTGFLLLIGGLSSIYLLRTGRESFMNAAKFLRGPILLFVSLFVGLIFLDKNTDELGVGGGVVGIATYFILSYIVGPLAAFDGVVQSPGDYASQSSQLFEFPLKAAASLHLMQYSPALTPNTFVFVPFPTNVYTMFKFYFLELGMWGTMLAMFLFGLAHSVLYFKAKSGSKLSIYLYGYMLYAIVLSIFGDSYYLVGGLLRATIVGVAYLYLSQINVRLLPSTAMSGKSRAAVAEIS